MNELPQIFARRNKTSGCNRQGPLFNLKLNSSFFINTSVSEEKAQSKHSSNLKLNRYSIDRSDGQSRKRIGYKTISYDHLDDPEFYGTKGKQDQSASYNVQLQERWKAIEVVRFKVEALKGFKDSYQSELKRIESKAHSERQQMEVFAYQQLAVLRQTVSSLRRESGAEIKAMKTELKQFNEDLLFFCEEYKKVNSGHEKCKAILQKDIE